MRAAGDIDLINVGQFQAALDQAAATSSAITADMTAVTYCDSATIRALFIAARQARLTIQVSAAGPINETLLKSPAWTRSPPSSRWTSRTLTMRQAQAALRAGTGEPSRA